jgi:hypothetical protein
LSPRLSLEVPLDLLEELFIGARLMDAFVRFRYTVKN